MRGWLQHALAIGTAWGLVQAVSCAPFGSASEGPIQDGGAEDVVVVDSSGSSDSSDGGTDGDSSSLRDRFCNRNKTAAICADFDEGKLRQVFLGGVENTLGVTDPSGSASATVTQDGRFLATAGAGTEALLFVPMLAQQVGPAFELRVYIASISLPSGGRVELMRIPASDNNGVGPFRIWATEGELQLRTDADVLVAGAARPTNTAFGLVLTSQTFGINAASGDTSITFAETLPILGDFELGAGHPSSGTATVIYDNLLVTKP